MYKENWEKYLKNIVLNDDPNGLSPLMFSPFVLESNPLFPV